MEAVTAYKTEKSTWPLKKRPRKWRTKQKPIACEMMPPMLKLPDCAAAMIAGSFTPIIASQQRHRLQEFIQSPRRQLREA